MFNDQNKKHGMDMIFIEILQLNWYAVPELPPSRNTLHNCTFVRKLEIRATIILHNTC